MSTQEQRPDRQIAGLRDCCDDLHVERLSAASRRRPVFERVINQLRPNDRLAVWDLDRAFRSTRDALNQIEHLRARGIEMEVIGMNLDMATPIGTVVDTIMSALAQFERDTLAQRTREGLEAVRRRGVRFGRPPKLNEAQIAIARLRLCRDETTIAALADEFGVAPWTLGRALKRGRVANPRGHLVSPKPEPPSGV